jgi:hypothetical protein
MSPRPCGASSQGTIALAIVLTAAGESSAISKLTGDAACVDRIGTLFDRTLLNHDQPGGLALAGWLVPGAACWWGHPARRDFLRGACRDVHDRGGFRRRLFPFQLNDLLVFLQVSPNGSRAAAYRCRPGGWAGGDRGVDVRCRHVSDFRSAERAVVLDAIDVASGRKRR